MTLARAWSVALSGVQGRLVEVECDLANGLPGFAVTGLPDASVGESRDRVRAAVLNSGEPWPARRLTVGLYPATLPKVGSGFDLAIAVTILAASGAVPAHSVDHLVFIGELGLDGRVRPVRGVLPAVMTAVAAGRRQVVVPSSNAVEAALVPEASVHPVDHLIELVAWLRGAGQLREVPPQPSAGEVEHAPDLADVVGHDQARLALELAAAGGHHLLMVGPPGCGKTMLAERLPGLLPALDRQQQLEVAAVRSVAGTLAEGEPIPTRAPFYAPHHSASVAALIGGGAGMARPGAVSLAHHGVLFLDEAPEFRSGALEALRQPLESGRVEVARARGVAVYPARTTLVLAANPCPCAPLSGDGRDCECPPALRGRYLARLSGPLLDRVDLRVHLHPVTRFDASQVDDTATAADRVRVARRAQAKRYAGTPWRTTSEVPGPELRRCWESPPATRAVIAAALAQGLLSARGADRVLRVAWTLADLQGRSQPDATDAQLALTFREVA